MKITILLDSLGKGGKERRLLALIKGLLHSHDVHLELIVFKDKIHYREVYDLGIPVHIIERKPRYDPLTFLKLYRLCRRFKPDIIHTWATMCSYLAYPSQKLLGCKVVNSNIAKAPNHLRFWHREFLWEKGAMLLSDAIVSNSQAGLRAYKAPRSRSRVIANGFDLLRTRDVLRGDKMKRKLNIHTTYVVGMVAAFADRKDYITFFKTADQMLRQRDDITFIAVGGGPNFEYFKNQYGAYPGGRMLLAGQVNNAEAWINMFDIGLLLTNTRVHGEGISNSILEYMAFGKPVIATEGGGTSEIVEDGVTGFLVPPNNSIKVLERIDELLHNTQMASNMGNAGATRLAEEFSIDRMVSEFYDLYRELIT